MLISALILQVADTAAAVDVEQLQQMFQQIFDAVTKGQWWLVAAGAVRLLTSGVRWGLPKLLPGKVGQFFDHPVVKFLLPFVLSLIGGLIVTLSSGAPFTVALLLAEVAKIGAGAVALYVGEKQVKEAIQQKSGTVLSAVIGKNNPTDKIK